VSSGRGSSGAGRAPGSPPGSRRRALAAACLLVALASGCVAAGSRTRVLRPEGASGPPPAGPVLLLPVDVTVLCESSVRFRERDVARSRAASANVSAALAAELVRRGYEPRTLANPSADELETIGAHRRLLRQLSELSPISAVEHGTNATVHVRPDLRVGPGLAALAARGGCERALLVFGAVVEETGSRRVDDVTSVLLNFTVVLAPGIPPGSGLGLSAAWVDLASGAVLWLGTLEETGGSFSAAPTPSDGDDARTLVARLLDGLAPTKEAGR